MNKTDYLIATNSFLSGVGRILDLFSTRNESSFNGSKSELEADYRAIRNDWNMVGQDIWEAYRRAEQEIASF
jgi:hypothetical protein|nr:MAG TPA: hypothetical protein [Caudoviricetes sp.]